MEHLKELRLPVDDLVDQTYRKEDWGKIYGRPHGFKPHFRLVITLPMVQDERVRKLARDYVSKLLQDREKFGYLYFLASKKLVVPLNLQFSGELVIDESQFAAVRKEIEDLARGFACPYSDTYAVTCLEILYFYTMLLNPHLNWITVDYLLRGNKSHDYLILQKLNDDRSRALPTLKT